jgi:hypothetical protein
MKQHSEINVSVVAFEREGQWIAQCVEYDIAAFSDSLAALPDAFSNALFANICINQHLGRDGLDGVPAAPARFRDMFESAPLDVSMRERGTDVPPHLRVREMRIA